MQDKLQLTDSFPIAESEWKLCEASEDGPSVVDGVNVLARVVGQIFLVNGISQNNRFYSESLWEKAISNKSEGIKKGLLGVCGHSAPINDEALGNGSISHLTKRLWIEEVNGKKVGMGEIYILGTDAGKQLNVLMRAGHQLPVSSRAYGKVLKQGTMGEDIIDPDSFTLEGFDFVLNPGVQTAYVKVVENKENTPLPTIEDNKTMSDDKKSMEESLAIQTRFTEALEANQALRKELDESKATLAKYKKAYSYYAANFGKVSEAEALVEGLRKWLELPVMSDYAKQGLIKQYGWTPASAIKKLTGLTESFAKLGVTPKDVKELQAKTKAFESLGSVEQIDKVFKVTESYVARGSVSALDEQAKALAAYEGLGTPAEIKAKLNKVNKYIAKFQEAQQIIASRKISKKLGVNEAVALDMVKKMGVKSTIQNLKKMAESATVTKTYKVETVAKKNEAAPPVKVASSGFASKFFESMKTYEPVADHTNPSNRYR